MNDSSIDELLEQSIQRLRGSLASRIVAQVDLAPIMFLRSLLMNELTNLQFDSDTELESARSQPSDDSQQSSPDTPSMEITKSNDESVYRISRTYFKIKK